MYLLASGNHAEALKCAKQAALGLNSILDNENHALGVPKDKLVKELQAILNLFGQIKEGEMEMAKRIEFLSSKIGNSMFYPWVENSDEFDVPRADRERYMDSDGVPKLSEKQMRIFSRWERPEVALGGVQPVMEGDGAETLCQDSLEDCSFVASLLSILFYERRHGVKLLKKNIYPQASDGKLKVAQDGKYWVRLNVNGAIRKVVVDDFLPVTKDQSVHSLFVRSTGNTALLWPAILEKAYLKLMGGYNFLGSYSASDTYALCSYIPEVLFINGYLQEPNASRDALWTKMYNPFQRGDVMICVGTGDMAPAEEKAYGLISDHDYTVMDLKEVRTRDGRVRRIAQIKNPWISENKETEKNLMSIKIPSTEAPEAQYGGFWVNFDSLCLRFSSIYFNWNPSMFSYKTQHNFLLGLEAVEFSNKSRSYYNNPQLKVENKGKSENVVWLLLSRHLTDLDNSTNGYVSLNIYDAGGNKVYLPDEYPYITKGTYLNTLHYLTKLTIPAKTSYTVVVCANDFKSKFSSLRFTLSSYSLLPVSIAKAPDFPTFKLLIEDKWDSDTAGGSWAHATYLSNPRYLLTLHSEQPQFKLLLSSDSGHPLNYRVYMASDQHTRNFANMKVVATSGEFKVGSVMAKPVLQLKQGSYMVVPSLFEAGLQGGFALTGRASAPFELTKLPSLNAGLFVRDLQVPWNGNSRRQLDMSVRMACTAYIHVVEQDQGTYRPHLRVSLFEMPANKLVASSRVFTDSVFGVYLEGVELRRETRYVCLVERMECGEGVFRIEMESASPAIIRDNNE